MANTSEFGWMWSSFFFGWLIKYTVMKFGGLGAYRKLLPLFLGIVLGDLVMIVFGYILSSFFGIYGFGKFP